MFIIFICGSLLTVVTHFTSSIFFQIILLSFVVTEYLYLFLPFLPTPKRDRINIEIMMPGIFLILYTAYVSGGFRFVILTLQSQIRYIFIQPTSFSGDTQGLIGLTYGHNLFISQWFIRVSFVLVSLIVFVKLISRQSDRIALEFVMAGMTGSLLLVPVLLGTTLSPSRVMMFFAIPYGLIFAEGFEYSVMEIDYDLNTVVRAAFILLLLTASLTTVMKLPQFVVGETQPIRGPEPIDDLKHQYLSYDGKPALYHFQNNYFSSHGGGQVIPHFMLSNERFRDQNKVYTNAHRSIIIYSSE